MRTQLSLVMLALLAGCPSKPAPITPTGEDVTPPPGAGDKTETGVVSTNGADRPHFDKFELDGHMLKLPQPITFTNNSDTLDEAASLPALWYVHDYLASKPDVTLVRIEGHDTEDGKDAMIMTGERALAVGRWLAAHDIDCKRLLVAAFGNSKPIVDPAGPDRSKNRRIELVNAELRMRAIGGMPTDGGAVVAAPVCDE